MLKVELVKRHFVSIFLLKFIANMFVLGGMAKPPL